MARATCGTITAAVIDRGPEYHRLINCGRWRKLRRAKLTAQPLCERCEESGRHTLATEVHHIRPAQSGRTPREMERLMYDPQNLRSLCHRCHVETHRELGKWHAVPRAVRLRRVKERTDRAIAKLFGGEEAEEGDGGERGGRFF